ncbi:MAG: LptF/LptG family permease, partial [Pseudomonadota bacterium]
MGRTLQIYIFKYMLRMTAYFAIGLGSLIFLADFSEMNNRLSAISTYQITTGLALSAARLPFILQIALPLIVLASTMAALMQLNKKNELVVARSAGVSAWQFLTPTWLAAGIIGILAVLVINPLATTGFSFANEWENQLRGKAPSAGVLSDSKPWLRQQSEDGGLYLIGAERVSSNGVILLDASFLHIDATGEIIERFDSPRALLDGGNWILNDALASRAGQPTREIGEKTITTGLDSSVITEALIPPEMIPFFELGKQIDTARAFGVSSNPFRMQYHSLMSQPALLIAMTLIAATVSLRFSRFGQS